MEVVGALNTEFHTCTMLGLHFDYKTIARSVHQESEGSDIAHAHPPG